MSTHPSLHRRLRRLVQSLFAQRGPTDDNDPSLISKGRVSDPDRSRAPHPNELAPGLYRTETTTPQSGTNPSDVDHESGLSQ